MKKQVILSVFVLIAIFLALFLVGRSDNANNQDGEIFEANPQEINAKLQDKLGQSLTYTGIAQPPLKGYYALEGPDGDYCLFFSELPTTALARQDQNSLEKIYMSNLRKSLTAQGKVEKRIDDYGECRPVENRQRCGKYISYCIMVEKIA